jgi:hypothetical protein
MDRRTFIEVVAVAGVIGLCRHALAAPRLVIVVNPKNPVRSLGAGEIEAIFTTRRLDWPGGSRIVAFNFPPRHPAREEFDRRALHLEPDEVARFWIDRRVRGGHPPPRQIPDARTMLRVVASLETAVGYVASGEADGSVRVVAEI